MIVPFEADINASLATQIHDIASKPTVDRNVINLLLAHMLLIS